MSLDPKALRALLDDLHDASQGTTIYFDALTAVERAAMNALPALLALAEAVREEAQVLLDESLPTSWWF